MISKIKKERLFILLIVLASLFLNFYRLEHLPLALHNDEAEHGLEALRILQGQSKPIGLSKFYGVPLPSFLHQSLTIFLFGDSIFGLRAASVLISSLTLPFFFYLGKMLFGKRIAFLSTTLLTFSHFWIAFARLGINYNLSVFFMIIAFVFLMRVVKKPKAKDSFFLGGFTALSLYLYFSSRIVPMIIAGALLFAFLRKLISLKLKTIFLFSLGFLLISLPMARVYFQNPDGFMSRTNNVFLFSPQVKPWLEDVYQTNSKIKILAGQIVSTLSLSSSNADSSGQYGYPGRIFCLPTLAFFLLGMGISFFHLYSWPNFFLLFWFWLVIIFGSFLTVPPRFLPRILGALPAVYLFFSLGLLRLKDWLETKLKDQPKSLKASLNIVLVVIVILVMAYNLFVYFFKYPGEVWGDANKYKATAIGKIIKNYPDYEFVFFSEPFLYPDFSTLAYLAPGTKRVSAPKGKNYFFDPKIKKVFYIFYPEYFSELSKAKEAYPLAELKEIKLPSQSQVAVYLLKVD